MTNNTSKTEQNANTAPAVSTKVLMMRGANPATYTVDAAGDVLTLSALGTEFDFVNRTVNGRPAYKTDDLPAFIADINRASLHGTGDKFTEAQQKAMFKVAKEMQAKAIRAPKTEESDDKSAAELIKDAQAGSDDAAQVLKDKAAEREAAQTAHDDVTSGRVSVSDMEPRKAMLTSEDRAERNANARDKNAKPATGTALKVCGWLKAGKAPHEVVSADGVARIDRLHYVLTQDGVSGYRFTLVTVATNTDGSTARDKDGNAKTQRTHIEVLRLTDGTRAVSTVTAGDMNASTQNATPAEIMWAAIRKAEAKGKLSARLKEWKATLTEGAQA